MTPHIMLKIEYVNYFHPEKTFKSGPIFVSVTTEPSGSWNTSPLLECKIVEKKVEKVGWSLIIGV